MPAEVAGGDGVGVRVGVGCGVGVNVGYGVKVGRGVASGGRTPGSAQAVAAIRKRRRNVVFKMSLRGGVIAGKSVAGKVRAAGPSLKISWVCGFDWMVVGGIRPFLVRRCGCVRVSGHEKTAGGLSPAAFCVQGFRGEFWVLFQDSYPVFCAVSGRLWTAL